MNLIDAESVVIWSTHNQITTGPRDEASKHLVHYLANMIGTIATIWGIVEAQTDVAEAGSEFMAGFIEFQASSQGMDGSERAAIRHYERASKLDPDFVFPLQQLGILYKNRLRGSIRYEEASAHAHMYAKRVLDLQPDRTFLLGTINSFLDLHYDAAIANLEHARSMGHSDGEVEREIGLALLSKGEIPEAIERLKTAEEIGAGTNISVVHWDLARAYSALGRYQTAVEHFDRALTRFENTPWIGGTSAPRKIGVYLSRWPAR